MSVRNLNLDSKSFRLSKRSSGGGGKDILFGGCGSMLCGGGGRSRSEFLE